MPAAVWMQFQEPPRAQQILENLTQSQLHDKMNNGIPPNLLTER